jgi:hypothetical protein
MRLALTLDSKVVQSAERFRGKHEHFQNARQLRFGCWRDRDFAAAAPRKSFSFGDMLSQLLCGRANGGGI